MAMNYVFSCSLVYLYALLYIIEIIMHVHLSVMFLVLLKVYSQPSTDNKSTTNNKVNFTAIENGTRVVEAPSSLFMHK